MKKILSIMFLFLYLSATSGINVQLHYCHGFLSHINFGMSQEDPCDCQDISDKHCCADEFRYIKINESHIVKNYTPEFQTFELIPVKLLGTNIFHELTENLPGCLFYESSPTIVNPGYIILNCVWRI